MLTLSYKNIDAIPPSLSEQLHDLTLKYEALEHEYSTIKLENDEYKKHISEIERHNNELKQDLICFENKISANKQLMPLYEGHITSIQIAVKDRDYQMEQLKDKLFEYTQLIKSLQSENMVITQQNQKFGVIVERAYLQKRVSEQINNDTINHNLLLQNENQLLRNELSSVNDIMTYCQEFNVNNSMQFKPMEEDLSAVMEEDTVRIDHDSTDFSPSQNEVNDEHMRQHIKRQRSTAKSQLGSATFLTLPFDEMSIPPLHELYREIDELKIKLERLEMENTELLKKLNESIANESNYCNGGYIFVDDEYDSYVADNEDSDAGNEENEENEMEQLCKKCDGEILKQYNDSLIEKYRILWFEFQIRRKDYCVKIK